MGTWTLRLHCGLLHECNVSKGITYILFGGGVPYEHFSTVQSDKNSGRESPEGSEKIFTFGQNTGLSYEHVLYTYPGYAL